MKGRKAKNQKSAKIHKFTFWLEASRFLYENIYIIRKKKRAKKPKKYKYLFL